MNADKIAQTGKRRRDGGGDLRPSVFICG